jgi:hypothetical protein
MSAPTPCPYCSRPLAEHESTIHYYGAARYDSRPVCRYVRK